MHQPEDLDGIRHVARLTAREGGVKHGISRAAEDISTGGCGAPSGLEWWRLTRAHARRRSGHARRGGAPRAGHSACRRRRGRAPTPRRAAAGARRAACPASRAAGGARRASCRHRAACRARAAAAAAAARRRRRRIASARAPGGPAWNRATRHPPGLPPAADSSRRQPRGCSPARALPPPQPRPPRPPHPPPLPRPVVGEPSGAAGKRRRRRWRHRKWSRSSA
eukprot:scaffold43995_cov69-Phaeocystis_antarctica.AAC.2